MAEYNTAAEEARHQYIWDGFCRFLGWSTGGVILLLVILAATLI